MYKFIATGIAFLLCAGISAQTAQRQPEFTGAFSIPKIDTWKIHSTGIGEDFTLYVLKTDDYDTTNHRLPVLYMTDGDWNMTVAMNCFSMLRQDYITHEPLVVGIGYGKNENKRVRDLDPETGGPAFFAFITKEVMPFIEKNYRTTKEKSIYGYSMGGMFTNYILFNHPGVFDKIFIGAPGNNGRTLMPAARKYFKDHSQLAGKVFVGVGSYEYEVVKNIDSFINYLHSKKSRDLEIRSEITPKGDHGSALAQVMQNAVAYGYCERHIPVSIDPSLLSQYTGSYVYYENSKVAAEAEILKKGGKLFFRWNNAGAIAEELIPSGADEFFIESNEFYTFLFRKENGKQALSVRVAKEGEYRFTRK